MSNAPVSSQASSTLRRGDITDDIWKLFTSVKLALVLILLIAAALLAGALIMQAPSEIIGSPETMRSWVERARPKYGFWTDPFQTLGLFWVFQTLWFRGLLGLLAINIVVCTLNRVPDIWRHVFRPKLRPADGLFERGKPREMLRLSASRIETSAGPLRKALGRCGYRVMGTTEPAGVYFYADRFAFARFGTLISHAALVLVLVAAVVSEPLGFFQEPGFAVPVGSTRAIGHGTRLSLYVEDFADEYHPDGRPKDYRSDVVLFDADREVVRTTIRVNEPLDYGGVRIHQSYYGPATVVSVKEPDGKGLFRDAVALTWRSNDGERGVGYFYLPSRDLHVYLVGTAGEGDPIIKPGEVLVEAYQGKVSQPTHRATLTQGRPLTIAGLEFLFEREVPFTGLRVVRDPGATLVWIASALLIAGIALAFYFPHRRLWVRAVPRPAGVEVAIVGAGTQMTEEIRRIADRLRMELQATRLEVSEPVARSTKVTASVGVADLGVTTTEIAAVVAPVETNGIAEVRGPLKRTRARRRQQVATSGRLPRRSHGR